MSGDESRDVDTRLVATGAGSLLLASALFLSTGVDAAVSVLLAAAAATGVALGVLQAVTDRARRATGRRSRRG